MDDTDHIASTILENPEFVRAAFSVHTTWQKIVKDLIDKLNGEFHVSCASKGWTTRGRLGSEQWSSIACSFKTEDQYSVTFAFEGSRYRGFGFGLSKEGLIGQEMGDVQVALTRAFSDGQKEERGWAWWAYPRDIASDWDNQADPWFMIASGRMAKLMFDLTVKVHETLRDADLLKRLG